MPKERYVTLETLPQQRRDWIEALGPYGRHRPLPDLEQAALLVVDMQRFFADPSSHAVLPALPAILPGVLALARAFARAGRPVVLTRHGSPDPSGPNLMHSFWRDTLVPGETRHRLLPELEALPAARILDKERYSAFAGTGLADELRARGCKSVVVCGVMTHLCVESTVRDAFMSDLLPVVPVDGCASVDETLHLGSLRAMAHGFAVPCTTLQLLQALPEGSPVVEPRADSLSAHQAPRCLADDATGPRREPQALCIVGAGPAGLAAAILATRSGLCPLLLDEGRAGPLACTAYRIETYPGFVGGLPGAELMRRFQTQAEALGIRPLAGRVTSLRRGADRGWEILHSGEPPTILKARTVILATGTRPTVLRFGPGGAALEGDPGPRLAYRSDAFPEPNGRRFLVLGGGEAALDQAARLRSLGARQVVLAMRGPDPRAMPLLVRRAHCLGVEVLTRTRLLALHAPPLPSPLAATLVCDDEPSRVLEVEALLACLGREPDLPDLPTDLVRRGPSQPRTDELGRTSLEGLYLSGDVRRGRYRQVAIAVGDGLAAVMHAKTYLETGIWSDQDDNEP